jgi:hypothetical protein
MNYIVTGMHVLNAVLIFLVLLSVLPLPRCFLYYLHVYIRAQFHNTNMFLEVNVELEYNSLLV